MALPNMASLNYSSFSWWNFAKFGHLNVKWKICHNFSVFWETLPILLVNFFCGKMCPYFITQISSFGAIFGSVFYIFSSFNQLIDATACLAGSTLMLHQQTEEKTLVQPAIVPWSSQKFQGQFTVQVTPIEHSSKFVGPNKHRTIL